MVLSLQNRRIADSSGFPEYQVKPSSHSDQGCLMYDGVMMHTKA